MAPPVIRFATLEARPWVNGLGISREIASGEGWTIAVADLGAAAAFSHFPAQDRVFTLIDGPGATLSFMDRPPLPCLPFVPAGFPGDVPCHYEPREGAARAFNLIVGRGRFEPRVAVRGLAAGQGLVPPAGALALFCAGGAVRIGDARLEVGDTMLEPGSAVAADGPAIVILVELG
ncbi:HutD/Ves family protein [Pararoseomonas indoligenes]|uniref:HutD family protein n=1 Tax=Roseomonas indoligenes TaxID=2820811 RepID=A0A940S2P7_9PROT|nr:HutD family protein [Pararoseomonas indoligenes]MBP0491351.1 HutD family protein [Pararoseomonas indoligenes]